MMKYTRLKFLFSVFGEKKGGFSNGIMFKYCAILYCSVLFCSQSMNA